MTPNVLQVLACYKEIHNSIQMQKMKIQVNLS